MREGKEVIGEEAVDAALVRSWERRAEVGETIRKVKLLNEMDESRKRR